MKCKALKSFVAVGLGPVSEGDVFELPDGADFVKAGLAEPVKAAPKKKPATKKKTTKKSD